jgi:hypothetical protein
MGLFLQKYFLFPHVLSGVFSYHDTPFGHNPQLNTGKTGAFLTSAEKHSRPAAKALPVSGHHNWRKLIFRHFKGIIV